MDQLEQRYVLENQMVGGKLNKKRAGVYGTEPLKWELNKNTMF